MRGTVKTALVGTTAVVVFLSVAAVAFAADSRVADAAEKRDAEAVAVLLSRGADVNGPQGDGALVINNEPRQR